ncbi:hypothetical protein BCR36DRAFT_373042 [Piromyces finnis]|uniref:Uncharacterized protein n=1 Tax=Piromyces finnis TaxID=1754191 RepID=A0A1Y1V2D9_9FUNG|nr:hypothetical protein BCR36DRAFT_373042 [Piromyces finnis]|eukprot:ORX44840.1 hypothetical protein BCR36DRAFT_373042 [Piromyces finnis]
MLFNPLWLKKKRLGGEIANKKKYLLIIKTYSILKFIPNTKITNLKKKYDDVNDFEGKINKQDEEDDVTTINNILYLYNKIYHLITMLLISLSSIIIKKQMRKFMDTNRELNYSKLNLSKYNHINLKVNLNNN